LPDESAPSGKLYRRHANRAEWSTRPVRTCVKWNSRTVGALLMLSLALPAFGAMHREQHVVRDGQGWMQESSGPLTGEKLFQVTRFVGSVRVVAGARPGSYLLRLHSQEAQEKDARKQFTNFHVGVGRTKGENIIQTVGPIDMALRAELILQLPAETEILHVDTLAGKITITGKVPHLDLQTHRWWSITGWEIRLFARTAETFGWTPRWAIWKLPRWAATSG
jgi:hypothetical protein